MENIFLLYEWMMKENWSFRVTFLARRTGYAWVYHNITPTNKNIEICPMVSPRWGLNPVSYVLLSLDTSEGSVISQRANNYMLQS